MAKQNESNHLTDDPLAIKSCHFGSRIWLGDGNSWSKANRKTPKCSLLLFAHGH